MSSRELRKSRFGPVADLARRPTASSTKKSSRSRQVTQEKVEKAFSTNQFINVRPNSAGMYVYGLVSPAPLAKMSDKDGFVNEGGFQAAIFYDPVSRMKGTALQISEAVKPISSYPEYESKRDVSNPQSISERGWTREDVTKSGAKKNAYNELMDKFNATKDSQREDTKKKKKETQLDDILYVDLVFTHLYERAESMGMKQVTVFGKNTKSFAKRVAQEIDKNLENMDDQKIIDVTKITPAGQSTSSSDLNKFLFMKKNEKGDYTSLTDAESSARVDKLKTQHNKSRYYVSDAGGFPDMSIPIWSRGPSGIRGALDLLILNDNTKTSATKYSERFEAEMRMRPAIKMEAGEPSATLSQATEALTNVSEGGSRPGTPTSASSQPGRAASRRAQISPPVEETRRPSSPSSDTFPRRSGRGTGGRGGRGTSTRPSSRRLAEDPTSPTS